MFIQCIRFSVRLNIDVMVHNNLSDDGQKIPIQYVEIECIANNLKAIQSLKMLISLKMLYICQ